MIKIAQPVHWFFRAVDGAATRCGPRQVCLAFCSAHHLAKNQFSRDFFNVKVFCSSCGCHQRLLNKRGDTSGSRSG